MSDEVKSKEEEKPEENKQTNRTFTQSDVDKLVAEQIRKATEKFKYYESIKGTAEALKKEKEERELAEKSELERKEAEIAKLKKQTEEYNAKINSFILKEKRDGILSDAKYSELPSAYKRLVEPSEDEDALKQAADAALEQYKNDFKKITSKDFGVPENGKVKDESPAPGVHAGLDLIKQRLRDRMAPKKK